MTVNLSLLLYLLYVFIGTCSSRTDVWNDIACNEVYQPKNCDLQNHNLVTVDDFDRCAPARLNLDPRNYFLAAAGRRITYRDNKEAFDRINIIPKVLRDVSKLRMETVVLGKRVEFPIGFSPVAMHKLAHPEGELATIRGISPFNTIMVLSSHSSTLMENAAAEAKALGIHLWAQVYIFTNRSVTLGLVRRAERSGLEAIVVTADSPQDATVTCDGRNHLGAPPGVKTENLNWDEEQAMSATFDDIRWLTTVTSLPIVVKGILSADDASSAILSGASAIYVSNHGGRQMDGDKATINALPDIVREVKKHHPRAEVFMDGGVRSGHDVFKALARGANMVFVGRPQIWGLAMGGYTKVHKVMKILRDELRETMAIAGISSITNIKPDSLEPSFR